MADQPGSTDEEQLERTIAGLIMDYLTKHPRAMDTTEGVASWWIASEGLRADLATTQRALEYLVERGSVMKIGEGAHAHFGLRKRPDVR